MLRTIYHLFLSTTSSTSVELDEASEDVQNDLMEAKSIADDVFDDTSPKLVLDIYEIVFRNKQLNMQENLVKWANTQDKKGDGTTAFL